MMKKAILTKLMSILCLLFLAIAIVSSVLFVSAKSDYDFAWDSYVKLETKSIEAGEKLKEAKSKYILAQISSPHDTKKQKRSVELCETLEQLAKNEAQSYWRSEVVPNEKRKNTFKYGLIAFCSLTAITLTIRIIASKNAEKQ